MSSETRALACPVCQYANAPEALLCAMCSEVLQRVSSSLTQPPQLLALENTEPRLAPYFESLESEFEVLDDFDERADAEAEHAFQPKRSWQEPVAAFRQRSSRYYLLSGLGWALFFSLPFYLFQTIGWFFQSVVHEMGHTLSAYFVGRFALPALRLDGHAATVHFDQTLMLALPVWLFLILASVYFWKVRSKPLLISFGSLALLYPILAFTRVQDLILLMGGHGGEMVIATVFFWRSLVPGKALDQERTLYAALAWYLWGHNLFLNASLFLSAKSRAWYLSNGSFGLENDWVRVSQTLGWSLPFLAFCVFLAFLAVPPLGLLWAKISWKPSLSEPG